jgi:V/A-type H+/Na+-transporting ATPase subunit E
LRTLWKIALTSKLKIPEMEGKLRELTDRIYTEGVTRARTEAEQILAEARREAERLTAEATREVARIREEAREEAELLRENTASELRLSARQAVADLKQRIAGLIAAELLSVPLQDALGDAEFLQRIIQTAMSNWKPDSQTGPDLQLLLPEKERGQLDAYIAGKSNELLAKGLHIRFDERLNDGFRIGPADGSFVVSFTKEDFERFFRMYLRPQVDGMLFGA